MLMMGGIGVVSLLTGVVGSAAVPVVALSASEIRWNGTPVVRLVSGRLVKAALDGHVVRRLDEVARPVFRATRVGMRAPGEFVRAELRADGALSWGVVARVILTLELAGADRVSVSASSMGESAAGAMSPSKAVVRALWRHRDIKWSAYPTVWLTRRGYSVYTHPSGRIAHRLRAGGREWEAVLAAIREVFVREQNLDVMAEDAIPFRDLLRVRERARALGFEKAGVRPGLFR